MLPKGAQAFRKAVVGKLESEQDKLTSLSQEMFHRLFEELVKVEAEVAYYDEKLLSLATTHPECQRLLTIPGIGPITATALIAAVGDVSVFKNGRHFSTCLGLVPKQHSTGGEGGCWGSVSGAIVTCASCSFTGRDLPFAGPG